MPKQYGTPGPRFIYPEACTSRSLASCHPMAQLLFDRLLTQCDDQGRLEADADVARALCMPLIPQAKPRQVEWWLKELTDQGMLLRYEADGRNLIQVSNWWSFQAGMRRTYPSRWPAPDGWEDRVRGVPADDRPPLPPVAPDRPPRGASARPPPRGSRAEPSRARIKAEPSRCRDGLPADDEPPPQPSPVGSSQKAALG